MDNSFIVEMLAIEKRLAGRLVLNKATLWVRPAAIHGLVGQNGAGKTVLMQCLYGIHPIDGGMIRIRSRTVRIRSPRDARRLRIAMVHQSFSLIDELTVAENVVLGHEPARLGLLYSRDEALRAVRNLASCLGFRIDATLKVRDLQPSDKQKVEILRALLTAPEVLILDEPTSVLSPGEVKTFFEMLKELRRNRGIAIIFISHKQDEVFELCDTISVMRAGEIVFTKPTRETDPSEVLGAMLGDANLSSGFRPQPSVQNPGPGEREAPLLELRALQLDGFERKVDLKVFPAEIVGIAGLAGEGIDELGRVLSGRHRPRGGSIVFCGRDVTDRIRALYGNLDFSYVPADRDRKGLALDLSVAENSVLGLHRRSPYAARVRLRFRHILDYARNITKKYDIDVGSLRHDPVRFLSGGTRQKLVLGREIGKAPRVLIVEEPTQGLDLRAKQKLYADLVEARSRGTAVLLLSSDLGELCEISDRVVILRGGEIVAQARGPDFDIDTLATAMVRRRIRGDFEDGF